MVEQERGGANTPQLIALSVFDETRYTPVAFVPELVCLAVVSSVTQPDSIPSIPQYSALCVYGEGAPEDYRVRAWGFTMDGHRFYVLHLGEQGSFVYDFTSGQWAEWKTLGFTTGWNAYVGMNWGSEDRIIAGDRQNPTVWEINPDTFVDEDFKPIDRTVTAIIPQSGFGWKTLNSVQVYASVGDPSDVTASIELTYSDDQGVTYEAPGDSLVVVNAGENTQQLDWMSLGSFQSPGRIIRITDRSGVARIDRASYEVS